jgi:hypothetical protein
MPCVTKVGPTNNDIVISTNRSKRDTEGTRLYLDLVKKKYENYIKIQDKFSTEKRQIARDIAASLLPGRFMKEIKGQQGQWFVLSEEEAEDRVMQRFCDERAAKARKAKAAKKVSPKGTKKVSPKGTKKKTPKVNKTRPRRLLPTPLRLHVRQIENLLWLVGTSLLQRVIMRSHSSLLSSLGLLLQLLFQLSTSLLRL